MRFIPINYTRNRKILQLLRLRPQQAVKGIRTALAKKRGDFPTNLSIEVTNYCNLACSTCPQSHISNKRGYLNIDLFKKIIDECCQHSSLFNIMFTGFGEPLLHPQLIEMSLYAKSKGIPYVRGYTNCVLLDKQKTDELLLNSGFDEITLSLNAPTQEIYERITKSRNYKLVTENIEFFLTRRKVLKARRPFVNIQLLKLNDVPFAKESFVEKWMPFLKSRDCIAVKDSHSYAGQVNDPGVKVVVDNSKRVPCGQLWNHLVISWNGDVSPCCADPFKKLKIGNAWDSSLKELWRSPTMLHMREMHMQKKYHRLPLCGDCEIWWYFSGITNPHSRYQS